MRTKINLEIEIEDGKVVSVRTVEPIKEKTTVLAVSEYARYFGEGNPRWQDDAEINLIFLKTMQNYANDLLKTRGYVFLNEVYELLGIPRTKIGQIVGWIYGKDGHLGDGYIDFDIYNTANQDFVNGHKGNVLLDFNVDGNILDVLKEGEA